MKTHLTKISFIFKCCGHYHISFKPFKFLSFTIIFVNIIHHTLLPRRVFTCRNTETCKQSHIVLIKYFSKH